jgi:hypothetical protein
MALDDLDIKGIRGMLRELEEQLSELRGHL